MRTSYLPAETQKEVKMATQKKYPGTPVYQNMSARNGRQASYNIIRDYEIPKLKCIYPVGKCPLVNGGLDRIKNECLATGMLIGFGVTLLVFGLILWLWVIPTMDAAVETAKGMVL